MSTRRSLEILTRPLNLGSDHAVLDMIVDQSHCLHEGVYGRRADKFPALLFEVLGQSDRFRRGRCSLRLCKLPHRGFVTPNEGRQRPFPFDEFLSPLCIVDDGLDLAAMADDAFILEQTVEVAPGEARYPVEVEIMKSCAKVLSLGENGAPAQSGLKAFQTQFLEQAMIVADRETPLGIVIDQKLRRDAAPSAA